MDKLKDMRHYYRFARNLKTEKTKAQELMIFPLKKMKIVYNCI